MTGVETALIIGAVAASAGAVASGVAAKNQADFQSDVARQNAAFKQKVGEQNAKLFEQIGERNAEAAVSQARAEEARLRRGQQRRLAAMRARAGASGLTMVGSPLEMLSDTAREFEEEAQLLRFGGKTRAEEIRFNAALGARRERLGVGASLFSGETQARGLEAQGRSSLIAGIGQGVAMGTTSAGTIFDEELTA